MKALKAALRKDALWLRFTAIIKSASPPEFIGYPEELMQLHRTRGVRVLGLRAMPTGKKIADAALRDQAVRSRCVEISMSVIHQRNFLVSSIETISAYLIANFDLSSIARSVTDRKAVVSSLVSDAQKKIDDMNSTIELANLVINDVDKASWALKSTVEALSIATARERTL